MTPGAHWTLPETAWAEVESSAPWATLGPLVPLSRGRRDGAVLEALRRVVGGGLQPSSRAVLRGLQRQPELNGRRGAVLGFDGRAGRWVVFGFDAAWLVNASNLQLIGRIAGRCSA